MLDVLFGDPGQISERLLTSARHPGGDLHRLDWGRQVVRLRRPPRQHEARRHGARRPLPRPGVRRRRPDEVAASAPPAPRTAMPARCAPRRRASSSTREIYDRFRRDVDRAKVAALRIGNGLADGTDIGPVASPGGLDRHRGAGGRRGQARRTGDRRRPAQARGPGYFCEPTVLDRGHRRAASWPRVEPFGPMRVGRPFDDLRRRSGAPTACRSRWRATSSPATRPSCAG